MSFVKYSIKGGLSNDQIEDIHKGILQVLEKVGVEVNHKKTLECLSEKKGVTVRGTRVFYKPWLVEEFIKRLHRGKNTREISNDFKMAGGYHCSNILDMDSGKIRIPTTKDLIKMVKLLDALGIEGGAPVVIRDIPKKLEALTAFKICWENSYKISGYEIWSVEELKCINDMAHVVGKKVIKGVQVYMGPLQLNPEALDLVWETLDQDMVYFEGISGAMPMLGVTTPIFFPAAWIQAIADGLAGYITTRLISGGKRGTFDIRLDPFDMKYANIVFGSPEWILLDLMKRQLNDYFLGYPGEGKFRSTAKAPDAQAAAERSISVLMGALAGERTFYGAGQMAIDEVFSPEQLVIDREILSYIERFIRGFEFLDEEGLSLKVIEEVGPGGNYLDHSSTIESYRKAYWMPELFEHHRLGQWQKKGSPSIRDLAREIVRKKIKTHCFELDENLQKELNKIYQKACNKLL